MERVNESSCIPKRYKVYYDRKEEVIMKKIILASASPRRKELLERAGVDFEVMPASGEEKRISDDPGEAVKQLASDKAASVTAVVKESADGTIVIGSDTVVVFENKILGKPQDTEDAVNTLKKLQFYMGKRKVLMPIALTLSGLSGLLSLMPFIFIWLIVRSLLLTGSVASGIPISVYAWWAVGTAVAGLVIYFAGLMLLHLAAFRVETNMRRTAMRKIMQMPLGFFDRNTSGQMRKIIDENASETHTVVAHLLPDLAGSFIAPLSVIILIFVFNWQLGLACLIPLTAAVFIMTRMNTTAQKAFQNEYLGAQEHMSSEAVEYVRGISVVKVFQQTIFSF